MLVNAVGIGATAGRGYLLYIYLTLFSLKVLQFCFINVPFNIYIFFSRIFNLMSSQLFSSQASLCTFNISIFVCKHNSIYTYLLYAQFMYAIHICMYVSNYYKYVNQRRL